MSNEKLRLSLRGPSRLDNSHKNSKQVCSPVNPFFQKNDSFSGGTNEFHLYVSNLNSNITFDKGGNSKQIPEKQNAREYTLVDESD